MVKIILSGCGGRMGQAIEKLVQGMENCQIVAGFDVAELKSSFPVFLNPMDCDVKADAVIDFSHPSCLGNLLAYAKKTHTPIVVATTGLSPEQHEEMRKASEEVGVFFSANMSLGINLLLDLVSRATKLLEGSFDIEIIEKHHNQKLDAPSGTALMIADKIKESMSSEPEYVYDRHAVRQKRRKNEIGLHALRGGTIVGEHEVLFCGQDEVIEIKHSAASREVFAAGAIRAAEFMAQKPAGFYNMQDLVNQMA